jgi:hypothetical protein
MSTDRELLELAAKAAGYQYEFRNDLLGLEVWNDDMDNSMFWNPLDDDRQAFRLAVKLRMDVTFNEIDVMCWPSDGQEGQGEPVNVDDPDAATRRAIVNAAAAMGGAE